MDTYDEKKIGKLIAWIGDHFVYEYDTDKVIKFSKFDFFLGRKKAKEKSNNDYVICKQYFGKYILETRIVSSQDGQRIAKIQQKVSGRFLAVRDLQNEHIKTQFREILQAYDVMRADGRPHLDLIGQKGVWQKCMSNILITKEHHLMIFDATLFDAREFSLWQRPFMFALFYIARSIQDARLDTFRVQM